MGHTLMLRASLRHCLVLRCLATASRVGTIVPMPCCWRLRPRAWQATVAAQSLPTGDFWHAFLARGLPSPPRPSQSGFRPRPQHFSEYFERVSSGAQGGSADRVSHKIVGSITRGARTKGDDGCRPRFKPVSEAAPAGAKTLRRKCFFVFWPECRFFSEEKQRSRSRLSRLALCSTSQSSSGPCSEHYSSSFS